MTTTNQALLERRLKVLPKGLGVSFPIFADKAKNSEVWDVEGNRYIDFVGGIGVLNTGHSHPKIVEAVSEQVQNIHTHPPKSSITKAMSSCAKNCAKKPRLAVIKKPFCSPQVLKRSKTPSKSLVPKQAAQVSSPLSAAGMVALCLRWG